jgi:hypothetical protein
MFQSTLVDLLFLQPMQFLFLSFLFRLSSCSFFLLSSYFFQSLAIRRRFLPSVCEILRVYCFELKASF